MVAHRRVKVYQEGKLRLQAKRMLGHYPAFQGRPCCLVKVVLSCSHPSKGISQEAAPWIYLDVTEGAAYGHEGYHRINICPAGMGE